MAPEIVEEPVPDGTGPSDKQLVHAPGRERILEMGIGRMNELSEFRGGGSGLVAGIDSLDESGGFQPVRQRFGHAAAKAKIVGGLQVRAETFRMRDAPVQALVEPPFPQRERL